VRFIYFITWEKAQVFNCPPSASQTVMANLRDECASEISVTTN
jgi:hypothetical protein